MMTIMQPPCPSHHRARRYSYFILALPHTNFAGVDPHQVAVTTYSE